MRPPPLPGRVQGTRARAVPGRRTAGPHPLRRSPRTVGTWTTNCARALFDPVTAHRLVLARRPPLRSAVNCVVSDLVWGEVVCLLRWATAWTGGTAALETGRWWRLAASCADLRRRLPLLSDELDEPWDGTPPDSRRGEDSGAARIRDATDRLAWLLRSSEPVSLHRLAAHVDALGAAAVGALAGQAGRGAPRGLVTRRRPPATRGREPGRPRRRPPRVAGRAPGRCRGCRRPSRPPRR